MLFAAVLCLAALAAADPEIAMMQQQQHQQQQLRHQMQAEMDMPMHHELTQQKEIQGVASHQENPYAWKVEQPIQAHNDDAVSIPIYKSTLNPYSLRMYSGYRKPSYFSSLGLLNWLKYKNTMYQPRDDSFLPLNKIEYDSQGIQCDDDVNQLLASDEELNEEPIIRSACGFEDCPYRPYSPLYAGKYLNQQNFYGQAFPKVNEYQKSTGYALPMTEWYLGKPSGMNYFTAYAKVLNTDKEQPIVYKALPWQRIPISRKINLSSLKQVPTPNVKPILTQESTESTDPLLLEQLETVHQKPVWFRNLDIQNYYNQVHPNVGKLYGKHLQGSLKPLAPRNLNIKPIISQASEFVTPLLSQTLDTEFRKPIHGKSVDINNEYFFIPHSKSPVAPTGGSFNQNSNKYVFAPYTKSPLVPYGRYLDIENSNKHVFAPYTKLPLVPVGKSLNNENSNEEIQGIQGTPKNFNIRFLPAPIKAIRRRPIVEEPYLEKTITEESVY